MGAAFTEIRFSNCGGEGRPGGIGGDDLIDDSDLDRLFYTAGNALVLSGELSLDLRTHVVGDLGKLAAVEDTDGGNRAHHSHLSSRPRKDPSCAE